MVALPLSAITKARLFDRCLGLVRVRQTLTHISLRFEVEWDFVLRISTLIGITFDMKSGWEVLPFSAFVSLQDNGENEEFIFEEALQNPASISARKDF